MFTSSKMSMSTASQPKFMTTTMKEKTAERNGARRIIINPKKKSPPKDELVLPGGHEFPYTAGSFYVGEWQGDKKSGFGTQTWTSGDKYEGEWSEGKQQGRPRSSSPREGRKGVWRRDDGRASRGPIALADHLGTWRHHSIDHRRARTNSPRPSASSLARGDGIPSRRSYGDVP